MYRRWLRTALILVLVAASAVTVRPGRAEAAAAFASIDASPFVLDPADSFQRYGDIVARIEASGKVTRAASLSAAVDGPQDFTPTWGFCGYSTGIAASRNPAGFCWDPDDDDWADSWRPQGISGSWDAQPDLLWENRKFTVASWHGAHDPANPNPSVDEFARLTFVDHTSTANLKFRDVLLVVPTTTAAGVDTFTTFNWNHADGVLWYGNTLLVANGGRLHAFSLRHLWAMTRFQEEVGFGAAGTSAPSGRWHRYVLPMVGEYYPESTPTGGYVGCSPRTGLRPCLNSISLDRRGSARDSFVSAEFVSGGLAGGRAFRWPMSAATALPLLGPDGKVHAEEAYTSPIWHMQGIASNGTNWFISGTCAGGSGTCVHKAAPNVSPSQQVTVNRGLQNLSYQPSHNGSAPRLWGLTEGNDRFVFNISVP